MGGDKQLIKLIQLEKFQIQKQRCCVSDEIAEGHGP